MRPSYKARKDRYRNDPEFRSMILERVKKHREKMANDPMWVKLDRMRQEIGVCRRGIETWLDRAAKWERRLLKLVKDRDRLREEWRKAKAADPARRCPTPGCGRTKRRASVACHKCNERAKRSRLMCDNADKSLSSPL